MGGAYDAVYQPLKKEYEQSLEGFAVAADPGGLFYTAQGDDWRSKTLAEFQGKVDIGGYGAKSTLATREAQKKADMANLTAAKAAIKEKNLVEAQRGIEAERKRRQDERRARRIQRGSLMYVMDTGMGDTLGG